MSACLYRSATPCYPRRSYISQFDICAVLNAALTIGALSTLGQLLKVP